MQGYLSRNTILIIIVLISAWLIIPQAQADSEDDLRYSLARVRLLLETDQSDQALRLIEMLKKEFPHNSEVLSMEAEIYIRMDNKGKSLSIMREAKQIAPEDEDILQHEQEILGGNETFASLGDEVRLTGHSMWEQISTFQGQISVNDQFSLATVLDNDHIKVSNFMHSSGNINAVDEDVQRGELGGIYTQDNGNQAKGSLFFARNIAGVGGAYNWLDKYGNTGVEAALNRTDWEYPNLTIDNGTQDMVKLSRTQILTPRLTLYVDGSFNNYNIDHATNVAQSGRFDADLTYTLPKQIAEQVLGQYGLLKVDYIMNSEYTFNVEQRTDAAGAIYQPFPIKSYEDHALELTADKKLWDKVNFEAFGGYATDRFGGNGPIYGGSIQYQPNNRVMFEANASRTILGQEGGSRLDVIGINAKIMF